VITKILVPIDLEHTVNHKEIVRVASMIANGDGAGVVLMTIVEPTPVTVSQYLPKRFEKQLTQSTATALEKLAESMDVSSGPVQATVRFGSVYKEILTHAETIGADLIVMGSHEPNVSDFLLGGNASRVVRHATCSVHIVRTRSEV
jgi:nucleotide-binding universal stress UspA family protein